MPDLLAELDWLRRLATTLVADANDSDDVASETLLRALVTAPRDERRLRAWLAAVAGNCARKLHRTRMRRARHERSAARPEAQPSAADLVQRAELQQILTAAVLALREPNRDVVLLRFFEGLPPRKIAQRLGCPVATVRTRLQRALGELRESFSRQAATRESGRKALAPLTAALLRLDTPPAGTRVVGRISTLGAQLVISTKAKIAAGAAALALLSWVGSKMLGHPPPTLDAPQAAELSPAEDAGTRAQPIDMVAQRVRAGDSPPDPGVAAQEPYGSLRVRAFWADATPAADVAILFRATEEPAHDRVALRVVTDANGVARASRLHEGRVELTSDRGGSSSANVVAGADHEVRFEIPRGVTVEGVVVDGAGMVVAGADIWLTAHQDDWLGGRVVAQAGADGAFRVRAVDPTQSLGAIAPGFAPSELVDLEERRTRPDSAKDARITLVLARRGGAIRGRVLAHDGQPVAGALVAIGKRQAHHHRTHTVKEHWTPRVVTSGGDGAFACEGVEPGRVPLAVRAEAQPLWWGEASVSAGTTTAVEIRLEQGVTLRGTCTGADGAPLAGAKIAVLDAPFESFLPWLLPIAEQTFGRPETRADADGRYVLRWLRSGTLHVVAIRATSAHDYVGRDTATLHAAPGAELTWNPRLTPGHTIRGRVQRAGGGAPRVLSAVRAQLEADRARSWIAPWDEHGRFVVLSCENGPHTLTAEAGGTFVSKAGVWPDRDEIVLELPEVPPAASITGRIADTGHRLTRGSTARVLLAGEDGGWACNALVEDEAFHLREVTPGRYRIVVRSGPIPVICGTEWFDVLPGQALDIGTLRTEPGGSLVVRALLPDHAAASRLHLLLGLGEPPILTSLEVSGDTIRVENLSPGSYQLELAGHGFFGQPQRVDIVAGGQREAVLRAVPAAGVPYEVHVPATGDWRYYDVRVLAAGDASLAGQRQRFRNSPHTAFPLRRRVWLPPGRYRLIAEIDSRRSQSAAIEIRSLHDKIDAVVLDLR